jgi:hypothetical protein
MWFRSTAHLASPSLLPPCLAVRADARRAAAPRPAQVQSLVEVAGSGGFSPLALISLVYRSPPFLTDQGSRECLQVLGCLSRERTPRTPARPTRLRMPVSASARRRRGSEPPSLWAAFPCLSPLPRRPPAPSTGYSKVPKSKHISFQEKVAMDSCTSPWPPRRHRHRRRRCRTSDRPLRGLRPTTCPPSRASLDCRRAVQPCNLHAHSLAPI